MKRLLPAILLLLAACTHTPKLDITIKAPAIKAGIVTIKQANEIVATENIVNGSLKIERPLQSPGYYTLTIFDSDKPLSVKTTFEMYLENDRYLVEPHDSNTAAYPKITTAAKLQQQLSEYYAVENDMAGPENRKIDSLLHVIDHNTQSGSKNELLRTTHQAQVKRRALEPDVLKAYISKHQGNIVAAHIIARQVLEEHPEEYDALFKTLSTDAKNSDDGKIAGDKLALLTKLLPGHIAPEIAGNTANGQPFSKNLAGKRVTLIEFWKAGQTASVYHARLAKGVVGTDVKPNFGMLGIYLGNRQTEWQTAIKADKLTWPQVADLKGDDSPNVTNWGIKSLPAFFLVDNNWHIIKSNVAFADIDAEVIKYLQKHP